MTERALTVSGLVIMTGLAIWLARFGNLRAPQSIPDIAYLTCALILHSSFPPVLDPARLDFA